MRGVHTRLLALVVAFAGCNRGTLVAVEPGAPDAAMSMVSPPDAAQAQPDFARALSRERCNGADDDGDGRVDEGCPIRLTTDPGDDRNASIDGARVVWMRFPVGSPDHRKELWTRELPDGVERLVTTGVQDAPSLSGNRVALIRGTDLVVLDLSNGEEIVVEPPVKSQPIVPDLDGNLVVWSQRNEGGVWVENDDSYFHDLARDVTLQIGAHPYGQRRPLLDGTRVAWSDDRDGHHTIGFYHLFDLYTADLAAGAQPMALTHRAPDWSVGMPQAFEGGRVAVYEMKGFDLYKDIWATGTCALALYDVRDGSRREVDAPAPYSQGDCASLSMADRAVALEGKLMAVERDVRGVSDLELIDLDSGVRRAVTRYPRRSTRPQLRGGFLVWEDDRNDHWDLYFMDLRDLDAGDFFPEGTDP